MNPAWIEFAVRGAGLLVGALAVCWLARRATPGLRHGLLAATMLGLLALPALTRALPPLRAPVLPAASEGAGVRTSPPSAPATTAMEIPIVATATAAPPTGPVETALPSVPATVEVPQAVPAVNHTTATPAPTTASAPVPWVAYGWLLGAVLALLPWLLGTARVARWARQAVPFERDDLPALDGPTPLVHAAVSTPMTVGVWRPRLLLPTDARNWPRERLHVAIRHEQAHIQRRDVLKNAAARVAAALHWFDPLAWIAVARLRRESELACDEAVLRSGIPATTLAASLVEVARASRGLRLHGAACAMGPSGLERRVEAILSGRSPAASARRRWPRVVGAMGVCVVVAVVAMLQPTAREAVADEKPALTVGPADCDHTTIQAAVDAAPAGAVIEVRAGTYVEQVVIDKPLTLKGAADWTTQVESKFVPRPRAEGPPTPTILVKATRGVTLVGLRLSLRHEGTLGEGVYYGAVLDIRNAAVVARGCAIVGSPASGVTILGVSDAKLEGCLVAAANATGIAIKADAEGAPRVRIDACDVRYGHHRGITIGRGCDEVVVQRCRISGSGWHGIRYDDASPKILNNRITKNVRSAIYASGKTGARVEGNVFADTGLGAVGCWYHCGDTYVRNTFVHNRRNGLAILGGSDPVVKHNVFVDSEAGVRWGGIGSSRGDVPAGNKGTVAGNWFWANTKDTTIEVPAEHGNRRADPKLLPDHTLAPDSPARKAGVGAGDPAAATSPFPVQPEEAEAARLFARHMQKYGEWDRAISATPKPGSGKTPRPPPVVKGPSAYEIAQPWIKAIVRPGNKAGRAKAWAEVREALKHDDPIRNQAGLTAVLGTTQIRLDRASLRPLVLPLLGKLTGRARVQAFYVLNQTGLEAGDVALLLKAVRRADAPLRESASHLILMYSKKQIVGDAEAAVLRLLQSNEPRELREVFRGLWGGHFGPALEKRLLEFSRDRRLAHDVVYFALSTQENKSADVVRALARAAVERQGETWRVIWGLRNGIKDEAAGEAVADFYADRISEFARRDWVSSGLVALKKHGKARHAAVVKAFAEDEDLDPSLRKLALEVLTAIQGR